MTPKERIEALLLYFKMNANEFAQSIGLKRSDRIYFITANKRGISSRLANEICARYPEVNYNWLTSGDGDMLKGEEPASVPYELYKEVVDELTILKEKYKLAKEEIGRLMLEQAERKQA